MRKTIILLVLAIFLLTGCKGTHGGVTNEPTSTLVVVIPTTSDIIIDGPWVSLPENIDAGLSLDPELGAITLGTNPTDIVFVTQPDSDKDAFTNNIYSLGTFEGRLYLGYGDMYNNQGPVDLVSYDPTSGTLLWEMKDIPQEQLANWHMGESGRFYLAGQDSREPWAFGSFYFNDGIGWRKMRTIYRGLHVNDLVEFQGRLYALFSSDSQNLVSYPFILVSSNGGLTWEYEKLEEDTAQDTSISRLVSVHRNIGDELYAIAYIIKSGGARPEQRLYCFDGQSWQRMTFDNQGGDFMPRDLLAFQDRLLIQYNIVDAQTGKWSISTYSWDGQTQAEITYLRGRLLFFSQFIEQDGWLYALIPPTGLTSRVSSYTLARTRDLQDWEELGNVTFPEDVTPHALTFSHGRLYVGAGISWQGIEGNPPIYTLVMTSTAPLANATLAWDADVPTGASLSFQIQAGKDYNEFSNAPWLGPDGTPNSAYTTPGQALPAQQEGATIFWVAMSKSPNSSGAMPFVRTVTLQSTNGSTTFAVDEGSGLYTAANVSNNASFTSAIFELEAPLSGGNLFFDTRTPEGTRVTFQIRSGETRDELEVASFVGPDGSGETVYTTSGIPLWEGHNGHRFIQYRAFLSSDNPGVAPFLRQVTLVTRSGILDHLDVSLSEVGPWTAGEPHPIQITARSVDGQVVPISGELTLIVKSQNQEVSSLLSTKVVQLTNGEASVNVSLFQAIPSQICVEITDIIGCSEEVEVQPAKVEWLNVKAPNLYVPGPYISPHTDVGKPFSIIVTAMDRYNNIVRDYTGTIHCEIWKWKAIDLLAVSAYSFTATDAGSHRFEAAVSLSNPGEYSLVCFDNANPQIGGGLAITVGEFNPTIFP